MIPVYEYVNEQSPSPCINTPVDLLCEDVLLPVRADSGHSGQTLPKVGVNRGSGGGYQPHCLPLGRDIHHLETHIRVQECMTLTKPKVCLGININGIKKKIL